MMSKAQKRTRETAQASKKGMDTRPFRLTAALLLAATGLSGSVALANPSGEDVIAGSVSIERSGNHMVIEAGHRSAINWRGGFSIGRGESVQIIQPCARCTHLARDSSLNATRINGSLSANGILTIANPFGIYIGNDAIVDVGQLIAAAGRISNDDFLADRLHFDGLVGDVENHGLIQASNVALLGRRVANHGQIVSPDGAIFMLAGDEVWLGNWGSPVRIGLGSLDTGQAAVENTGTLDAGRGQIRMAAGDALGLAVRSQGSAYAQDIALEAEDGQVEVSGSLDASDRSEGGQGGRIQVLGEQIAVDEAELDASGDAGGGEILVGGDFQGANPEIRNARQTFIGPRARLRADAVSEGDGGKVIVWADEATGVSGELSARGGAHGGRGGLIETSSKGYLEVLAAAVDAGAPNGPSGEWLIDPRNVEIRNAPTSGGNFSGGDFTPDATGDPAAPAIVDRAVIEAALNLGTNVSVTTSEPTLDQDGDITVVDSITSDVPDGQTATLTLTADRNIAVNAPISDAALNGTLEITLDAQQTISLGAPITADAVTATTDLTGGGAIADTMTSEDANITAATVNLVATEVGNTENDGDIDLAAVTDLAIEATGSFSVSGDRNTDLRRLSITVNPLGDPLYALQHFPNLSRARLVFGTNAETSVFPNDSFLFPDFIASNSSPLDFSLITDQHLQIQNVQLPQGLAEESTATLRSTGGRIISYFLGEDPLVRADTIDLDAHKGIFGSLLIDRSTGEITDQLGIDGHTVRAVTAEAEDVFEIGIFLLNQPGSSDQDVSLERFEATEGILYFSQQGGGDLAVPNGAVTADGDLALENQTGSLSVAGTLSAARPDEVENGEVIPFTGQIDLIASGGGNLELAADTSTDGGDLTFVVDPLAETSGDQLTITGPISTTRTSAISDQDTGGNVTALDVRADIVIDAPIQTGGGDFFVDNRASGNAEIDQFTSGSNGSIDTRLFVDNDPQKDVLGAGAITIRSEADVQIGASLYGDVVGIRSDGGSPDIDTCVGSSVCFQNNPVIQARSLGTNITPAGEIFTGIRLQAGLDDVSSATTASVDTTGATFWGLDDQTLPGGFTLAQNAPIGDANLPLASQFAGGSLTGLNYTLVSQVEADAGGATISLATPSKLAGSNLTLRAPEDVDLGFSLANPVSLASLEVDIGDAPEAGFVVDTAFATGIDAGAISISSDKDLSIDPGVSLGSASTLALTLTAGEQSATSDGGNLNIGDDSTLTTLAGDSIQLQAIGKPNGSDARIVLGDAVQFQQNPASTRSFGFSQAADIVSDDLPAGTRFVDAGGVDIGVAGVDYALESLGGSITLTDATQVANSKLTLDAKKTIAFDTTNPIPLQSANLGQTGNFKVTKELIDGIDLLPGPDSALTLRAGTLASGTLSFQAEGSFNIDADRIELRAGPGACEAGKVCGVAFPTTPGLQFRSEDQTGAPKEFIVQQGSAVSAINLPTADDFNGNVGPTELFEIRSDYIVAIQDPVGTVSVSLGQPTSIPGTESSTLRVVGEQVRFSVNDQDLDMGTTAPRNIELESDNIVLETLSSSTSADFKVLTGGISRIRGFPLDGTTPVAESRPSVFTLNQTASILGAELPNNSVWYENTPKDIAYIAQSWNGTIDLRNHGDRVQDSSLVLQVFNETTNPIDLGQGLTVRDLEARADGEFDVNPTASDAVSVTADTVLQLVSGCASRAGSCEGAGDLILDDNITLRAPFISLGAGGPVSTEAGKTSKVRVSQNNTVAFELDSKEQALLTIFDIQQAGDLESANLPTSSQFTLIDGNTNPQGVDQIDRYQATSSQGSMSLEPTGTSAGIEDMKAKNLLLLAQSITVKAPELTDTQLDDTTIGLVDFPAQSVFLEATAGSVDATSDSLFFAMDRSQVTPATFSISQTTDFDPASGQGGLPGAQQFQSEPAGLDYRIRSDGNIVIPADLDDFYGPTRNSRLSLQAGPGGEIRSNGILFLTSLSANADPAVTGTTIVFDTSPTELATITTALEQTYASPIVLEQDASLEAGTTIDFTETIDAATPGAGGLEIRAGQAVSFAKSVGAATPLTRFSLDFAPGTSVARASFGTASSTDPIAVRATGDIELFPTARKEIPETATLFKANADPAATTPDLLFSSSGGNVVMGQGQKLSVPGILALEAADTIAVGDLSALELRVDAPNITLVRRAGGAVELENGRQVRDAGVDYVANRYRFCTTNPGCRIRLGGQGNAPTFGLPNPFVRPGFLVSLGLPSAAINNRGAATDRQAFIGPGGAVLDRTPLGGSASDLAEAFWIPVPTPRTYTPPQHLVARPAPLIEIGIAALPTSAREYASRLDGAGIIDDVDSGVRLASAPVWVSEARILPAEAYRALAAYARVLGPRRENAERIQQTLQTALDDYRSLTGARRVVGFEFRRYIKNRPNSQFAAYTALEDLDSLFVHQRRAGLVPAEFEHVQREWLAEIVPEGITLDELSQAIFPSRYVRGSEILDVYGE